MSAASSSPFLSSRMPVALAGYQGEGSLLTASLRALGRALQAQGWEGEVEVTADVTQGGAGGPGGPGAAHSAADLFASLERGERQLVGYMASGYLSHRVPQLDVLDLPFAVGDRQAALAALDGQAGRLLREAVHDRTGYQVLAFWDNGYRHLSNAVRPIRRPADCQGLVIRTLDSAAYRDALAALGFVPVSTDVKDLVRVVASGEVQAQENPLANLLTFSLWRHHRYVSLTGHFFGVLLLVCPQAWYRALGDAQRTALHAAVEQATALQRTLARERDEQALRELRDLGVQVLSAEELDLPSWRAATQAQARRLHECLPAPLVQAYLQPALH